MTQNSSYYILLIQEQHWWIEVTVLLFYHKYHSDFAVLPTPLRGAVRAGILLPTLFDCIL